MALSQSLIRGLLYTFCRYLKAVVWCRRANYQNIVIINSRIIALSMLRLYTYALSVKSAYRLILGQMHTHTGNQPAPNKEKTRMNAIADVQSTPDLRNMPINQVGIKDLRFPVRIVTSEGEQSTVGRLTMTVFPFRPPSPRPAPPCAASDGSRC